MRIGELQQFTLCTTCCVNFSTQFSTPEDVCFLIPLSQYERLQIVQAEGTQEPGSKGADRGDRPFGR